MKKLFILGLICLTGCKKLEIKSVSFDVNTDKSTYKVGETVTFNFTGNPDNITFYSGEAGLNYAYKDRTQITGISQLNFTTLNKAIGSTQSNSLKLLVSTNFNAIYDATNVTAATWTDITSRAALSTGVDNFPSGTVDLSDFSNLTTPVYFAFKFTGSAGTTQRDWLIRTFNVLTVPQNGPASIVTDINSAGWIGVNVLNPANVWSIATDIVRFDGPTGNTIANEDWVVTKPLNLGKVNPDVGVALKNLATYLPSYSYIFQTAGTYTVAFVASNTTKDDGDSVVKQMTITVTP